MDVACGGSVPDGYGDDKASYKKAEQVLDGDGNRRAKLTTSCGEIMVELFVGESPKTTNNFAFLAGEGFFDASVFHRVVPGFVIQGGDPTGTGTGGPGYRFPDELAAARNRGYERGTLAMANSGPNTNGSQFFICLDKVGLPPQYTVFGTVTDGMDAVDQIAAVPLQGESPTETVFLEKVELLD
jgi:peptidylprolyl isomerase